MELFEVGGCVRDEILGVKSNDVDFAVVLDNFTPDRVFRNPFDYMVAMLKEMDFKIFLETPEHLTVRAQFPRELTDANFNVPAPVFQMRNGLTADFVLARKEGTYSDGRRPDFVEPGTLEDDIFRRDFTMNALAKDADGNIIDLVGGQQDIKDGVIRAVGDPFERMTEDALRVLRAMRFSVTKGFHIHPDLDFAMRSAAVLDKLAGISDERIKDELSKMFRYDTVKSITTLYDYPAIMGVIFSGTVSLDATMKTKGRGK